MTIPTEPLCMTTISCRSAICEAVWAVFSQTEAGTGLYVQVDHHMKIKYYNAITSAIKEAKRERMDSIIIGPCCNALPQSKEENE